MGGVPRPMGLRDKGFEFNLQYRAHGMWRVCYWNATAAQAPVGGLLEAVLEVTSAWAPILGWERLKPRASQLRETR